MPIGIAIHASMMRGARRGVPQCAEGAAVAGDGVSEVPFANIHFGPADDVERQISVLRTVFARGEPASRSDHGARMDGSPMMNDFEYLRYGFPRTGTRIASISSREQSALHCSLYYDRTLHM